MISDQFKIYMGGIYRWLPLGILSVAIGGLPVLPAKGQCSGNSCGNDVTDSWLVVSPTSDNGGPTVNVTLEHRDNPSLPYSEDHKEDNDTKTIFKDFKFTLAPPAEDAQKSDPINLTIASSGGTKPASEEFHTVLKFSCYRKFEIEVSGYGTKQVGLGENVEDSIELSDPSYPSTNYVKAEVREEEDGQGNTWIYLDITSRAGGFCENEDAPFEAKSVTVYVVFSDEPGKPGGGPGGGSPAGGGGGGSGGDDYSSSMSNGSTATGEYAGETSWNPTSLGSAADLDSVSFHWLANTAGIEEVAGTSARKQLYVIGKTLVDVATNGTVLTIKYYAGSQVGAKDPNTGLYAVSGTPFKQVTITENGDGTVGYVVAANGATTGEWVLGPETAGHVISDLVNHKKVINASYMDGNGDLIKTHEERYVDGAVDDLVSKTEETHHTYSVDDDSDPNTPDITFEKLVKSVEDPDGAALTTTYGYETDPASSAFQSQIWAQYPDGGWEWLQYDNLPNGATRITWRPFKDAPWPSQLPTTDTGYVKEVHFTDNPNRTYGDETYIDGNLVSKRQTQETTWASGNFNMVYNLKVTTESAWSDPSGAPLQTVTYEHGSDSTILSQRTYAVVYPDSTCDLYEYAQGTYDPVNGTFTPGAGTDVRTIHMRGSVSNPAGPPIWHEGKSTAEVTYEDEGGNLLGSEQRVCDDANAGGADWPVMSSERHIYDGDDNLTETQHQIAGGSGWMTTYSASYDPTSGGLFSSVDEFGVATASSEAGRISAYARDDGRITRTSTTEVDVAGRILSQTDGGLTTSYVYETASGGGRRAIATLPSNKISITEYYRDGQIKKVSGTGAVARDYDYQTSAGTTATIETMGSRVVTTTADMMGHAVTVSRPAFDGGFSQTNFAYNTKGQLESQTTDSGTVMAPMAYSYDALGRATLSGYDMDGGGLSLGSTQDRIIGSDQSYAEENGKWYVVSASSRNLPSGLVTQQEVRSRVDGLETIVKGPGDRTVTTSLNVDRPNQTVTVTELDLEIGSSAKSVYAGYQTLVESQEPWQTGSTKTSYDYDGNGRPISITDAANRTTTITYHAQDSNGAGQEHVRTLPGDGTIITTYTDLGLVDVRSGTATYYQDFGYNVFGELTTLTTEYAGGQSTTTWQREPRTGLVEQKIDAANEPITYDYNAVGWLENRIWARNVTTTYGYTRSGEVNLIDYSDSTPDITGMVYDRGGRLTNVTDTAGARTITYSDFDQRADETYSGSGLLSGYSVNRDYTANRRTSLSASGPGGFGYPSATYSYDPTSKRLTGISQNDLTVTYTPQPGMSQPQAVTSAWSGGATLTRNIGYDVLGRTTYVTNSVGSTVLSAHGTSVNPIVYDTAGRRTDIVREDGSTWHYDYNTRNEVTGGVKKFSDGGFMPGHQFSYTYDGIGNRTAAARGGDSAGLELSPIFYTPNVLNQYSAHTNPTQEWVTGEAATAANVFVNDDWTWRKGEFFGKEIDHENASAAQAKSVTVKATLAPSGGNMVAAAQTGTILTPPENVSPTYDDDGNLTNDGLWIYQWDGENRLIAMETVSSLLEPVQSRLEFAYDFEGRRIQTTRYIKSGANWVADAAGATVFFYDGWNLVAERNSGVNRQYLWGLDLSGTIEHAGGVGGLLALVDAVAGSTYSAAFDANGNVSALGDGATGESAAIYEYGPFGEPLRVSGPMGKVNSFRWSSKYTNSESGLIYYGYRYYSPQLGRWINRDPLGENGGPNLYAHCHNDLLDYVDPLGLRVAPPPPAVSPNPRPPSPPVPAPPPPSPLAPGDYPSAPYNPNEYMHPIYGPLARPTPTPEPPRPPRSGEQRHGGVMHAHHCDLKVKLEEKWFQQIPFSKGQGLALLSVLQLRLKPYQQRDLANEFDDVRSYIMGCATWTAPPSHFKAWTSKKNRRNHVDIEVHSGHAF